MFFLLTARSAWSLSVLLLLFMNWYLTSVLEKLSLGVLWIFPRAARAVSWIENNYPAFLATSELVPEQSGSDTGRPYEGPVGAPPKCRPHRCLGAALSIATSILQSLSLPAGIPITMDTTNATAVRPTTGFAGRVVLLTSGPCTAGPGTVVDIDLSMHLRHWPDIEKKTDVAKHVKDAQRFYTSLGERAATNGISYHVFSCSVEQVGLYEMYQMVSMTGGHMMISESYSYQAFVRSWRCFFDQLVQAARQEETETTGRGEINEDEEEGDEPELVPLQFGSRAIIEASIGSGGKITGCVGHVVPLPPTVSTKGSQQAPTCSNPAFVAGTFYEGGSKVLSLGGQDNEIGHGFTNRWLASHIDSESTFCFCYEANHDPKNAMALTLPAYIPVQFRTLYIDNVTGDQILRVTTYVFQGANPLQIGQKSVPSLTKRLLQLC